MLTLSADTTELDRAARGLREAERATESALEGEVAVLLSDIALDASLYPPQPAGSAYVRSYDLERGWTTDVRGLEGEALNAVPYGEWVMGPRQAKALDHWRTTPTIAAQWQAQATERMERVAVQTVEGAL